MRTVGLPEEGGELVHELTNNYLYCVKAADAELQCLTGVC